MNLYQKLKPEIKTRLHRNSNDYAVSITGIIKTLKSKQYYNELTIGEIKQIRAFGDVTTVTDGDILWPDTMFNSKM
tara:strand:- start:828 stop:1055 length:228 start_codon:yes stop_codon:yes gene_type:complete